jgi:branched-chain amino acid transport system substrate-binding protein
MPRLRQSATAILALIPIALGGCLGDGEESHRVEGGTAVVYSSAPRAGVSAGAAEAVLAGQRRALADRGGRAGGMDIELRELSATDEDEEPWDPDAISENAKRAAGDPTAIAYLGELDYGATAVSLPITNDARLLQVSPADGPTSLTRRPPGRPRAGPERYYPSGDRSFARIGPRDLDEAELLVARARENGAERVAVVFDREIYGRELAGQLVARARDAGIEVAASEQYGGNVDDIPDLASALAEGRPDAVLHAGVASGGTGRMLAAIDSRMPGVPVYAGSGILARAVPVPAAPGRVEAVGPALAPERAGYLAMRLVLDAIEAGGRDRRRVIEAGLRLDQGAEATAFTVYRLNPDGRFEPSFSPR